MEKDYDESAKKLSDEETAGAAGGFVLPQNLYVITYNCPKCGAANTAAIDFSEPWRKRNCSACNQMSLITEDKLTSKTKV
ncbi:MAG: hypothetical protein PHI27_05610 [Eubacteriales bacterium]|nr:hypothetical protein [Eubacteriales bacterium]MDD3881710.1 hypothetical protein [Eubacteriales bacterium]